MKRTLWIFVVVLVITAGTIIALYLFRKNQALDQYVHPNSQAVVSIAVDDLLLDNMAQFFKQRTDSIVPTSGLLDIQNWWRAGIHIPAQIHFFTLKDNPLTFFTIQKIAKPEKWEAFLKEHSIDAVQVTEHDGQRLSFVHLASGTDVLYDDEYLLLRLTAMKQEQDNAMQAIWEAMNNWVYVSDFQFLPAENSKAHIAYRHTDGTFQLFANVSDGHVALSGDWHLTTDAPVISKIRKQETNNSFMSLWSTLSPTETPFIIRSLSIFSDVEPDMWVNHSYDYVDLFISSDITTQQDTIVTYDYDADFNSVEKKEIQEIPVPVIENVWKGDAQLAAALPEKLFYRFYHNIRDSLIILSTKKDTQFTPLFVDTSSPFQLKVDFRHLPSSWNNMLRPLQEQAFQIAVETSIVDKNTLGISGSIRYTEK
ncbi:hypothetical protein H8B06_16300 [Sphingobacterium sp. DN00404]|uniref:DUF3352 domain-containing protein n=1 Tax=Sphingobacterium micropteri TaxID=2763501 RepID=A0ABR7YST4_9SPHI|nr:hypothetical protein [Sphingobacterium micropteri]MBD1434395.1 hypothetical protein [Sphingobacterium micropteri]